MTDEEKAQAETAGGYAREMSDDYKRRQAELIASRVGEADAVITTALIPGRPAPKLITAEMIKTMRPGQRDRGHGRRDGRQHGADRGGQGDRDRQRRADHRLHQPAGHACPAAPPRCTPRTSRPWSSICSRTGSSSSTSPTRSPPGRPSRTTARSCTRRPPKALGIEPADAGAGGSRQPAGRIGPAGSRCAPEKERRLMDASTLDPFALVAAALHPGAGRLRGLRGGLQGADHAPHAADERRQRRPRRDRGGRHAGRRHGGGAAAHRAGAAGRDAGHHQRGRRLRGHRPHARDVPQAPGRRRARWSCARS